MLVEAVEEHLKAHGSAAALVEELEGVSSHSSPDHKDHFANMNCAGFGRRSRRPGQEALEDGYLLHGVREEGTASLDGCGGGHWPIQVDSGRMSL
jgi:hypothetical protein